MTFGEKIQKLRKEAGLSQEEFADRLDVSRQAVSKWERDSGYPETEKIVKMSRMFGVSVDYLLNDEDLQQAETSREESGIYVSRETADGFLHYQRRKMRKLGIAAGLFIGSLSFSFWSEDIINTGMLLFMACLIVSITLLISVKLADNPYRKFWKEALIFDKSVKAELTASYTDRKLGLHAMSLAGAAFIAAGFLFFPMLIPFELYDFERIANIAMACGMIAAGAGAFMCVCGTGAIRAYRLLISNEEYREKRGGNK